MVYFRLFQLFSGFWSHGSPLALLIDELIWLAMKKMMQTRGSQIRVFLANCSFMYLMVTLAIMSASPFHQKVFIQDDGGVDFNEIYILHYQH